MLLLCFMVAFHGKSTPLEVRKLDHFSFFLKCTFLFYFFYFLFFDWKRHRDILIDKKKYKKKDEESSRHRKLNYRKLQDAM